MKLREKFVKRKREFIGKAINFRVDEIRLPDGKHATREYIDHPGAVAVIPLLSNGKVIMVRQYRYPVDEVTIEIPAGKLDRGEAPLKSVVRELEEETGYHAGRVRKLLSFWPTSSFANEILHIYVADKLVPGKANLDEDEFLNAEIWPLKKVYKLIDSGKVKDAKTLIALLAYRSRHPGK